MKRQTARLLRGVIRLIEDDVRAVADSVVEIDEREAAHYAERVGNAVALERRVATIERENAELVEWVDSEFAKGSFSRKVTT